MRTRAGVAGCWARAGSTRARHETRRAHAFLGAWRRACRCARV